MNLSRLSAVWVPYTADDAGTVLTWALVDDAGDVLQISSTQPAGVAQPNAPQWTPTENGGSQYGVPGVWVSFEFVPAGSVAGFDVDTILSYRGEPVPASVRARFPGAIVRDFLTDPAFAYGRTNDFMSEFGDYLPYITAAFVGAAMIAPWAAAGGAAQVAPAAIGAEWAPGIESGLSMDPELLAIEPGVTAAEANAQLAANVAAEADAVAVGAVPAANAALPAVVPQAAAKSVIDAITTAVGKITPAQAAGIFGAVYKLAQGPAGQQYYARPGAPMNYAPNGFDKYLVDSGTPGVLGNVSIIARQIAVPAMILGGAYLLSRSN